MYLVDSFDSIETVIMLELNFAAKVSSYCTATCLVVLFKIG